jgi:hypothetical protein
MIPQVTVALIEGTGTVEVLSSRMGREREREGQDRRTPALPRKNLICLG